MAERIAALEREMKKFETLKNEEKGKLGRMLDDVMRLAEEMSDGKDEGDKKNAKKDLKQMLDEDIMQQAEDMSLADHFYGLKKGALKALDPNARGGARRRTRRNKKGKKGTRRR
jgi:hypothetical protein